MVTLLRVMGAGQSPALYGKYGGVTARPNAAVYATSYSRHG